MEQVGEIDLIDYAEGETSMWDAFSSLQYEPEGLLNIALIILMFILAKFVFRSFIMSEKKAEKSGNKNLAYSISSFSLFISLAVIMTSVVYGDMVTSTQDALYKIFTYASLGIVLLVASGYIFDKIALSQFNLNRAIAEGNESAAIVDASNFFASALIISSALTWQEFKEVEGVIAILSIYLASQILLTLATLVRSSVFNNPEKKIKFQDQIEKNNKAVAIDFAGRRIGTAFAITAATNLLAYKDGLNSFDVLVEWAAVSVVIVLALNALSWLTSKIVFMGENAYENILKKDIDAALRDSAIYISLGIILYGTLY